MENEFQPRVLITEKASGVVRRLIEEHGPLMFHQSGGCCDGSAPMCFKRNDFRVGAGDILLGEVEGCPYYIARDTFSYYRRSRITIDVVPGRGASFSLEIPLGVRFLTVSEIVDEEPPRSSSGRHELCLFQFFGMRCAFGIGRDLTIHHFAELDHRIRLGEN